MGLLTHIARTTTTALTSGAVDAAGILACLWWAAQSVALVLANKAVFSQPLFDYPWLILTIQCVVVVLTCTVISMVRREAPTLHRDTVAHMFVPSSLFLLYQYSNARSLRFISLPAFTVVKSLAPLGVTVVERFAFGNVAFSMEVYASLLLSLIANLFTFDSASAISQTSLLGYAWSVFNVSTHIFYVLSLRYCAGHFRATDKAFVANLVCIPVAFAFALANQELGTFAHEVVLLPVSIRIPLIFSFALSAGCLVSVLSAFEAASSDALRYLAQSNKIAIVLLGAVFFRTKLTPHAWFGVVVALMSGFLFVYAKSKAQNSLTALGIPRPIVSSPTLELLLPTEQHNPNAEFAPAPALSEVDDDSVLGAGSGMQHHHTAISISTVTASPTSSLAKDWSATKRSVDPFLKDESKFASEHEITL